MGKLSKHWPRIGITLLPMLFALLHASGLLQIGVLNRLDDLIYDARVRATMPNTLDDRIVIVDIDEKSLAEVGQWPWPRNRLATLVDELFDRQKVAILGFDVFFSEQDDSSGLQKLRALADGELKDQTAFTERLKQIAPALDYDAIFAKSLQGRPVVLAYTFTSETDARKTGVLPKPVMNKAALQGRTIPFLLWRGHTSNVPILAKGAPLAGFINPVIAPDGVVRSVPMVMEFEGAHFESFSLAIFRLLAGLPKVEPGFPPERFLAKYQGLDSIRLRQDDNKVLAIPVDHQVGSLVPFRGDGGPTGGSFRYISAADVLTQQVPIDALKGKIVIVGTTAIGLKDLRTTPVSEVYPGVEVHANLISGLLDGRIPVKPDYAIGFEVLLLVFAGLVLALGLPLLNATLAVLLSVFVVLGLFALNYYMYTQGLVFPLAGSLAMAVAAFALNMSYGYFVESKSKRDLANMFRGYIPPELVDEMVAHPDSYTMKAANKDMTVMFCDMRGFTKMSETMEPTQLQQLLNDVFSRLTEIIQANRGTIDKYMGDCVMAFWGAPVETPNHAHLATKTALEMSNAMRKLNEEHRVKGLPEIGVGIGLNSGVMCVGNMGSIIRRSYTVVGDAVNLGSRLEGLSKTYGVDIVVSETTRKQATEFTWQELDRVRVKGKDQAVGIFWPLAPNDRVEKAVGDEIKLWSSFLKSYRSQDWDQCEVQLLNLERTDAKKYLYQLYAQRVASMKMLPFDPAWDGATNFENK